MSLSSYYPHQGERSQPPQGHEAPDYRFLAVMQESADVFWILTPDGEMQEVCPSWQTFTGQRERDCFGRGWLDALHPADQPQIEETVHHAVTSARPVEMECHIRKGGGAYRLVHVRAIPVRTTDGDVREVIASGTDITRQELAGQMSETEVQLALKASGVGMWDWDLVTNQINWTGQGKALLGLSPDIPINYERFLTILYPDDREPVDRFLARVVAEHAEYHTEYRIVWPDGSIHWLSDRGQGISDAQGHPMHMVGAIIDITNLKQAEERTRAILESITEAFVHVDTEWRFTYGNRRAEVYAGGNPKEVLGQPLWDVFPEFLGTPIEHQLREAMATQQVVHFEAMHPRWQRWLEVHAYPALDGLSIYFQDITERKQAEEALRRSREEFRVLAETMPHLVWTAHPDGFLDYFNQQCATYVGSPLEQLTWDRWIDAVHPDDRQKAQATWQTTLQTGQSSGNEYRLREGKTGDYHWFLGRATPLIDNQGHILKWIGTSTNIDEKKRTEEALRQSRDAFRLLTEAMPQLVWTAGPDGYWEYANQQWYDYTGISAQQTLGEGWASCCHPDDQQKVLTLWHASFLTSQPFEVEARLRQGKTGAYRWFLVRAVPITTPSGRVWKWLGTSTDIHEKKCTEEALRESEVRFRRLVGSNIIGITVIDLEGAIREANDAFLSLVGYTREDLAAGRMNWKVMTPPEYQAVSAQAMKELQAIGVNQPYEKEYVTKDGKRVPVLMGGTILRREGATQLAISFVVDMTARKEMDRQKDLFLGMTGHELKTPLAALRGILQLVQRRMKRVLTTADHLSPEMSTFFDTLTKDLADSVRQIDVQTRLINDLLDVSRITANTLKLSLHRCDLGSIVRQTVEDLQVTAPERSLLLDLPGHTSITVFADADRISQVVTNYVTNALRYSRSDQPVHIGLTIQEDVARVWVKDKGPGLSEEAQNEIWQCFHQVKGVPVLSGSGKGLGLGLSICQMLIAQHQGEVGVESTPGEGSTFWFTLPIVI